MIFHLQVNVFLCILHCSPMKVERPHGVTPLVPINVLCSVFDEILPIRDWWVFDLNDDHWLIRTQAWTISASVWDVAFFQWSIPKCVREKIGADKCWVSLHSRNASFNVGETLWRRNRISPNTTKGWFLRIDGYFRIVCEEQIVHFPKQTRYYEMKSRRVLCWIDLQYRISGSAVSGSAELASPPLSSDSKALRSESDIFATSARGSCGVDPGPIPLRIVTFSASSMGDWLYGVRKRVVLSRSMTFSTFAMLRFTVLVVRGGGTDPILMRPKKGSPGAIGAFEGIAPSSA